ncbi:MAG: glutamate racemase [Chthoniobacterales bacterium]
MKASTPIGVFDSGIGGLTVVAALRALLPTEDIIYFGDTARVPYGGRSPETIERYSLEIGRFLEGQTAKIIVVACNTASALAIPSLQSALSIPVIGVVEPGAAAAVASTHNRKIGIIGTRATIASNAYAQAIERLAPGTETVSQASPLLVPLIEEGLLDHSVTFTMIRSYLEEPFSHGIDTLVLGCTHYPLLKESIAKVAGPDITLVDSASNCALTVKNLLQEQNALKSSETSNSQGSIDKHGSLRILLTDRAGCFLPIAKEALGLKSDRMDFCDLQTGEITEMQAEQALQIRH